MKNKKINIISVVLLTLLFFGWGMKGRFWLIFTGFFPLIHYSILGSVIVLFLLMKFFPEKIKSFFNISVTYRYFYIPLTGFIISAATSIFVFDNIPHVIDASLFQWTSRLLLQGRLSLPESPLYEYYNNTFMLNQGGRYYSLFLPGFSILSALFELIRLPWLLNPLCFGFSIYFSGKIADHFSDKYTSFLSMILLVFSSFHIFMSASFMTHTCNLLLTLLVIYIYLKKSPDTKWLLLAGSIGAYMFFIRPQNGLFTYIPIVIAILYHQRKIKPALIFSIPFLTSGLLLLYYNYYFTGSPFTFPQDIYFLIREPYEFCHRMGIGKGCPNTEGLYLPDGGTTWTYAFWVAYTRLTLLMYNLAAHPYIFIFVVLAFFYSWKKHFFLLSFFLCYFFGYFFFYLPGNLFGPRYFTEVSSLLLIIGAAGFIETIKKVPKITQPLLIAFPVGAIVFLSFFIMPALVERYSDAFWETDNQVSEIIDREKITNSLVFIDRRYPSVFFNTMTNPPYDEHGNLILKDLGTENHYAYAWFMEKEGFDKAYTFEYMDDLENTVSFSQLYEYDRRRVFIEAEFKYLPRTGKPDYASHIASDTTKPFKFYPFEYVDESLNFSNQTALALRFDDITEKSYFDFTHPMLFADTYSVKLNILAAPCGKSFDVIVNNKKVGTFSSYSPYQTLKRIPYQVDLKEGNNHFSIKASQKNSCLVLDYITITPYVQ